MQAAWKRTWPLEPAICRAACPSWWAGSRCPRRARKTAHAGPGEEGPVQRRAVVNRLGEVGQRLAEFPDPLPRQAAVKERRRQLWAQFQGGGEIVLRVGEVLQPQAGQPAVEEAAV